MITIRLPARITDDLNWSFQKTQGLEAVGRGEKIFWEFDLGLSASYFALEDELLFHSLSLSLTTFTKELWPLFQKSTEGACLYNGSIDFSSHFLWSDKQQMNWNNWKKERPPAREGHLRRLFCADSFAFYFQMLSHRLPDELPITLILNGHGCGTLAETLQLISKERFEHFTVELKDIPVSRAPSIAVCFPEEMLCSQEILEKMDRIFDGFEKPIRVIPEPFLTEFWEELEYLYVLSEAVTQSGKRKLMGFCASGGTVIVDGNPIGLPQEIGAEEVRGRGIRTPGLLVPNQSR
jgi:hypothetical protein